jgi:hypothetical protein
MAEAMGELTLRETWSRRVDRVDRVDRDAARRWSVYVGLGETFPVEFGMATRL